MEKKILKKYLGRTPQKDDARKRELIRDAIDLHQWEINLLYLGLMADRPASEYIDIDSLPDNDRDIVHNVTAPFANIVETMKATPFLYPEAMNFRDMYWYIAAYPDVVAFFYPCHTFPSPTYSSSEGMALGDLDDLLANSEEESRKETEGLTRKRLERRKILDKFRQGLFAKYGVDVFSEDRADGLYTLIYFVALKNFYKSRKKLLLSKE